MGGWAGGWLAGWLAGRLGGEVVGWLFGWLFVWLVVCLINLNKIAAVLFHNYVLLFGFRINNFRGSDQLRIHYVRVNEY